MNISKFCLTILAIGFLTGCNQGNREIIIKGGSIGDIPDEIRYTVPVSGNCFWGFRETIRPDSLGNFSINATIDKPSFIGLFGFGSPIYYMIVEPGKQYDVRIDLSSESEKISINGNTGINKLYNTFPNHEHPQFDELWSLFDSSATVIRETLHERKNQELSEINELYQRGEISIEVFNLLKQDRLLYNMNVLGFIASIKVLQQLREGHEMIDNEYMMLWHEANSLVPLSNKYFFSTIQAFQFLGNVIWYNLYMSVDFSDVVETQREFGNKGLRHTHNIELSRKYLDPDVLEYYQAAYIFFHSYQKR